MNRTEQLAKSWLMRQGYKEEDITFRYDKTPDFVCADGKRYEVKRLYGKNIFFGETQMRSLRKEDLILIFDKKRLVSKFKWGRPKECLFYLKVLESNKHSITIDEDVLRLLKDYCRESGAKISSTINAAVRQFLEVKK